MTISIDCPGCKRTLQVGYFAVAGRTTCPRCGTLIDLNAPPRTESDTFAVAPVDEEALPPSTGTSSPQRKAPEVSRALTSAAPLRPATNELLPAPEPPQSAWRLAFLLLAFIPLAYSVFVDEPDVQTRLRETLEQNPAAAKAIKALPDDAEIDDVLALLPDQRIIGAHLPRGSNMPWLYAATGLFGFFAIARAILPLGRTPANQLYVAAVSTATYGLVLLTVIQWVAEMSQHLHGFRGHVVVILVVLFVQAIGFSYRAALDPSMGLLPSLFGFTFGVGLCEEFVKSIPVLFRVQSHPEDDWRDAAAWGFASGVGFGAAEGIMYAADYYNGLSGGTIYVVRFISCVALHAVWSAAVGIAIWRNRRWFDYSQTWWEWGLFFLKVVYVPMILHGLYDTLLKRDMHVTALICAGCSVAWLAAIWERARRELERQTESSADLDVS